MSHGDGTNSTEDQPLVPPSESSFVRLARAYQEEGLLDDGIRVCRDGLKRFPESWAGRIILGKMLLDRGEVEEAYDELDRVRREASGRTEILTALEEALTGISGRAGENSASSEPEVLTLESDTNGRPLQESVDAPVHDPLATPTLAKLYASQGDAAAAAAILRRMELQDDVPAAAESSAALRAQQRYLNRLSAILAALRREQRPRLS